MGRATEAWAVLPFSVKLALIGGVVLLVAIASGGTGWLVSEYKDRALVAREAERATEREQNQQQLDAEAAKSQAAIVRAEAAERIAADEAAKRGIFESLLNQLGGQAEKLKERAANEDQTWTDEQRNLGTDVDPCERVRRSCARLKIKPADCACE